MEPVVVVGGGVLGASVARAVSLRTDRPVGVFERGPSLGAETTGASSLGLRQYGTTQTQIRMKREGRRLYNEFVAGGVRYEPTEVVRVATTDAGRERVAEMQRAEHPEGSPSELVPGDDIHDVLVLPDVPDGVVTAALHRPNAGYFHSAADLVGAFVADAEANGAEFVTDATVTDVLTDDDGVTGVVVDGAVHDASTVVAAAGPWNNALAGTVGLDVPVRHQRVHVLELAPDHEFGRPLPKLRHVESGVRVRGQPDGTVLAYHVEPADDPYAAGHRDPPAGDASVPESVVATVRESLDALVPAIAESEIVDERVAYPSRTPDTNPVVGWTAVPGFVLAATHSKGVQYAPAIGRIVASQVVDDDPTDYYPDVSIARFDGFEDGRE